MSRGWASVNLFPFPLKETVKPLETFPHVQRYVLPFPSSLSPERGHCHALRGQADCCHGAEADPTGNNRIIPEEGQFPAAVGGCHSYICQTLFNSLLRAKTRGLGGC